MSKKNTLRNYEFVLNNFQNHFGDIDLTSITSEEILAFMSTVPDGTKQNTNKLRFSLLSAFFNFVKNSLDHDSQNPCDNKGLRKLFSLAKLTQLKILEKDVVDEMIFRTQNQRNRLMLELMALSGMRVGEVPKLRSMGIEDRKAIIRDPKSGKEAEVAFLPQKVADRLRSYIRENGIKSDARIFPLTYAEARLIVRKAGNLVGVHVRPHELRRHAATYASRSGTPLEIVSKVLLRHSNLATTKPFNYVSSEF
ncbi:MAG: site-specific integrase [Deltaproteobacteria bacterium]|nr:site-specific integrase [Deltaproteobacteria bacterium]